MYFINLYLIKCFLFSKTHHLRNINEYKSNSFMKLTNIFFLVFLFATLIINANTVSDSLLKTIIGKSINEKAEIYYQISILHANNDLSKAIKYARKSYHLSLQDNNNKAETKALISLGKCLTAIQKNNDALDTLDIALQIAIKNSYLIETADAYNAIGNVYFNLSDYDKSIYNYFKSLKITSENSIKIKPLVNIANIYNKLGDYQLAMDYYKQAKNIAKQENIKKHIAACNLNIGICLLRNNKYDKSMSFLSEALTQMRELDDDKGVSIALTNLGSIYNTLGNHKEALIYYFQSSIIAKKLGLENCLVDNYYSIGDVYLHQQKYQEAQIYAEKSLKIAQQINSLSQQVTIYLLFSSINSAQKEYQEALAFHELHTALKDSIVNLELFNKIHNEEIKYNSLKRQKEMEILQKKKQISDLQLKYALSLIILLLTLGGLIFVKLNAKIKLSRLEKVKLKLENSNLEKELKYKNKELVTNVMYLVEKNELINDVNKKLLKVKISSKIESTILINGMIHELNSSLNTNIWEEFEIRFQLVHEEFYNKLNILYPQLSKNEKRICAFLRLNMTTKEISFITKQNQTSINVARGRLRKKLGICGTNVEMMNYLTNL